MDNPVDDPIPVAAAASIAGQIASAALADTEAGRSADSRPLGEDALAAMSVGPDGIVRWPTGAATTEAALLDLLRRGVQDQVLPPTLARLLLARPKPTMYRLAEVLDEVGSVNDLAKWVAATGGVASAEVDPPGDNRATVTPSRSPVATRARRSTGSQRIAGPGSTVGDRQARERERRLMTLFLGNPKKVVGAISICAVATVVALSVLVAGGAATSAPVVAESPHDAAEPSQAVAAASPSISSQSASSAPSSTPPVASALAPGAADTTKDEPISWAAVLADIDGKRQRLFATGDASLLLSYAKQGSAAADRDAASHKELADLGVRAVGLSAKINKVSLVTFAGSVADLDVTDELAGYRVVRADSGDVVESRPARAATRWRVRLERVDGHWLLVDAQTV